MTARRWIVSALAAAVVVFSTPLAGTAQSDGDGAGGRVGCLRGAPQPRCRSFWIVEVQGVFPLVNSTREVGSASGSHTFARESFEETLEWNLGHMANVGGPWAVGGTFTLGTGADDVLTGARVRVRRWLGVNLSTELELGAIRTHAGHSTAGTLAGPSAALRLNIRDQGSVLVRYDAVDIPPSTYPSWIDPGGFASGLSVGLALGSEPALLGTGAAAIVYAVLIGAFLAHAD